MSKKLINIFEYQEINPGAVREIRIEYLQSHLTSADSTESRILKIYYFNKTILAKSDSINIDSTSPQLPYDGGNVIIKRQEPDFLVIKGK